MNTLAKNKRVQSTVTKTSFFTPKSDQFWKDLEYNRFSLVPIVLVLTGCVGGVAAGFGALDSSFQLGIIAFTTVITLSLLLAEASVKLICYLSAVAILLDILVLIF